MSVRRPWRSCGRLASACVPCGENSESVCALGVNRHTEKAPEMTTFGAEKCATVAVTPQFIPSRSDLSVGTVVSTETVNKDCVHRTKS